MFKLINALGKLVVRMYYRESAKQDRIATIEFKGADAAIKASEELERKAHDLYREASNRSAKAEGIMAKGQELSKFFE